MIDNEKKEKLEFLQMFFVKSFLISFILLLISSLLCIMMHDYQLTFVEKYFKMNVEDFNYLIVLVLGLWKVLIIQFTLIPALAIWGMRHCCKCDCENK